VLSSWTELKEGACSRVSGRE